MSIIDPQNMPHTCSISERVYQNTSGFGVKDSLNVKSTDVKCWVQLASMREIASAQKLRKSVSHKVYFGANPELLEGDEIEITDSCTADQSMVGKSMIYRVKSDASAGLGILFKAFFDENQLPNEGGKE